MGGFGNYDFDFEIGEKNKLIVNTELENPFTGYHFLMRQAYNFNNTSDNTILANELFLANEVVIDSAILNSSYFNFGTYPVFGTKFDAFTQGRKISISSNPSSASILTYKTPHQGDSAFYSSPAATDNRKIFLSGLSIKVLKQHTNGNIEVSILWDDYDVDNDVRWCGDIVLKEKVNLLSGNTITLDQGLTPTQPVIDPISGEFAKPTVFTCEAGSEFILRENSKVVLKDKSTIRLKSGSLFEINDGAELIVGLDDTLFVEPCAKLIIRENGKLIVKNGGVLCISDGAIVATDKGLSANIPYPEEGLWEIPQGYIHPYTIIPSNNEIPSNSTVDWSGKNYQVNNIIVNSGATLNIINNSSINFGSQDSKIIIKPGGRVVLDNSKLTSSCNDYWHGIYIEGNSRLSQSLSKQGSIKIENQSVIENALFAGRLRTESSANSETATGTGGIIHANNSTFRNNKINVEFNPYVKYDNDGEAYDNVSYFSDCTFETSNDTPHITHSHNVTLSGVRGIRFTNCHIIDNRTNITTFGVRDGIRSSNSTFIVRYSTFSNLRYGIYAISSTGTHPFTVRHTDFTALHGIYFNSSDNVQILNNTFNIVTGYNELEEGMSIKCFNRSYGVYVDNAFNFKVENNWFQGVDINGVICGKIGIVANNTGYYSNEIYRNTFENLTVGIEAIGNNRGMEENSGLALFCNNLENNIIDVFVKMNDYTSRPTGIRRHQGSYQNPAGNTFSNITESLQSHFINEGDRIDYYSHNINPNYNLLPSFNISDNIWTHITPEDYDELESCPNRIFEIAYETLVLEKENALMQENEISMELNNKIDAGDSDDLKSRIDESGPGADIPLYQFLMQNAPFLSGDVLAKLAAKEQGFSNVMIRNVLVNSPQSPKLEKVIEKLDSRNIPLPPPMRVEIDEGLEYFGEKELMEQEAAYYKSLHDLALNEIIGNKIYETEGWEDVPEITSILSEIDDVRYQYLLAEIYFSEGNYEQGMQLLNEIAVNYEIIESEYYSDHLDYISFYSLLGQIDIEEYPGHLNLPEDILQAFEPHIESDNRVAGKALALLIMNEAIEYEEPVYYPEIIVDPKSDSVFEPPFISDEDGVKQQSQFNVYPNPAQADITISWCYNTSKKVSGMIEIYNSVGVLVHSFKPTQNCGSTVIDLSGWVTGNYTTVLNLEKIREKSINFIIAK